MKDFGRCMLIIGTVIGSGFASGKEISVFFSRFGFYSYFLIPFVFFLFYFLFYWMLANGKRGFDKLMSSKFYIVLSIFVSMIFTSSMFAGTLFTLNTGVNLIDIFLIICLLVLCIIICKKGVFFLAKINTFLIPILITILICCLIKNFNTSSYLVESSLPTGILFACLYVVMNLSTSCVVVGQIGQNLSKRQIKKIAFCSSFILTILLFFINYIILHNEGSLNLSMPLLEISQGNMYWLMRIVILLGCLTTLFSLIFTISQLLKKLKVSAVLNIILSVLIPFAVSFFGFGNIVLKVYPIASVLGILLLLPYLPEKKDIIKINSHSLFD